MFTKTTAPVTIDDVRTGLSEEQKSQLNRQAVRHIATIVAIKVGIAVTCHYATKRLLEKLDDVND